MADFNEQNGTKIFFSSTTFQKIIEHFNDVITDFDFEMLDLVGDYEEFCSESNLIPVDDFMMRVVPCGATLDENFEFGLYYDPVERGYTDHNFIADIPQVGAENYWG